VEEDLFYKSQNISGKKKLVFLGHWGWKWSSARTRYSTFEKELLAGVLLLAAHMDLLQKATSVWWFTDASGISDFIRGPPPTMKRRLRWWYFLRSFNLEIRHTPGVKKRIC
jgi:hypothetical protein